MQAPRHAPSVRPRARTVARFWRGLFSGGNAATTPAPPPSMAAAPTAAAPAPNKALKVPVAVDLENTELPINTHGVGKAGKQPPFKGRVVSIQDLGGRDKERHVSHIVIDTGGVLYHEGQSFGVVPPGTKTTSKGEVPQHVRLYSIAASRYGDSRDGKTTTLCVVRVVYKDPVTGEEKRGLCSNYLCDAKVGDTLTMTGPSGTALLMPDKALDQKSRIVCISTGESASVPEPHFAPAAARRLYLRLRLRCCA